MVDVDGDLFFCLFAFFIFFLFYIENKDLIIIFCLLVIWEIRFFFFFDLMGRMIGDLE